MTTGSINYDRLDAVMARNRNRRMLYELLDAFFWRAMNEERLDTAMTIFVILERFYPHVLVDPSDCTA